MWFNNRCRTVYYDLRSPAEWDPSRLNRLTVTTRTGVFDFTLAIFANMALFLTMLIYLVPSIILMPFGHHLHSSLRLRHQLIYLPSHFFLVPSSPLHVVGDGSLFFERESPLFPPLVI